MSDTHCYSNNVELDWHPCGPVNKTNPVVTCCGAGDYCMSDGLCFYTRSQLGGSGYYAGGCTDPNSQEGPCFQRCGPAPRQGDVVWLNNKSNPNQWACCEAVNQTAPLNCKKPSDTTMEIVPPDSLTTLLHIPSDYAHTSQAPHAATKSASSGGLSTGASVGIGLAATVAFFLAAAGAAAGFFVHRRRRRPGHNGQYRLASSSPLGADATSPQKSELKVPLSQPAAPQYAEATGNGTEGIEMAYYPELADGRP